MRKIAIAGASAGAGSLVAMVGFLFYDAYTSSTKTVLSKKDVEAVGILSACCGLAGAAGQLGNVLAERLSG